MILNIAAQTFPDSPAFIKDDPRNFSSCSLVGQPHVQVYYNQSPTKGPGRPLELTRPDIRAYEEFNANN
jgi:hypothetical protein